MAVYKNKDIFKQTSKKKIKKGFVII